MYWLYRKESYTWRNQDVRARLLTKPGYKVRKDNCGFGFASPLQHEPYGVELQFVYSVNPRHPHPDFYPDSHGFQLYSDRLLTLMKRYEVKFEAFSVTLVDDAGAEQSHLKYYVFHSLEGILDAMDQEKSEWKGDRRLGVARLVLDYSKFEHRPLFVCKGIYEPLMRDDLKQEIQRLGITGFGFLTPEKYQSGRDGYRVRFPPPYED